MNLYFSKYKKLEQKKKTALFLCLFQHKCEQTSVLKALFLKGFFIFNRPLEGHIIPLDESTFFPQ